MKGSVLLLAIFPTECYCDHAERCDSSSDCGENEFCTEDHPHHRYQSYCVVCPSSGYLHDECVSACETLSACIRGCKNSCQIGEYIEFMYL